MKLLTLSLLAGCLLLLGCKPRNPSQDGNSAAIDSPSTSTDSLPNPCRTIKIAEDGRMDPINSATALVEGDCLHLKVIHGGGCRDHDFQLLWNGMHMESMPPQVSLVFSHDAKEDHCRAILNTKESFDLKPLRYSGLGQVILNIRLPGPEQRSIRANYTYTP